MNPILQNKLNELEKAENYECWYLVKQSTEFKYLCYLVSFLEKYQSSTQKTKLEDYINEQLAEINKIKPELDCKCNYRALRVAAFFGLIIDKAKHEDAIITETFKEITQRCNGDYEKTDLYNDIIQRQIEKMFISSEIDEQSNSIRQNYRLYPVMLLYKVLIELGRSTGKYEISMTEYRYLVATTEKFQDYLETLLLIKLLRNESNEVIGQFEQYRSKFDNRLIRALKQLDTLNIDKEYIRIKEDKITEVAKKVFIFEENANDFDTSNYLTFLGSTKSLFENNCNIKSETIDFNNKESHCIGYNKIFYGIPGCGKSYYIENTVLKDVDKDNDVFRTTFYLDYSNSDFIGQIYPVVKNGNVTYEPKPGPFTKALERALSNHGKMTYLVIEEINRGNAAAIFGDTFQLLDRLKENRDDRVVGDSEYPVANEFIEDYFEKVNETLEEDNKIKFTKNKIIIPHNLTLLATMNTSDQNVFPLDTAFKRRWDREKVMTDWNKVDDIKDLYVPFTNIKWKKFVTTINNKMLEDNGESDVSVSEDKQIGAYFVKENMLSETEFGGNEKSLKAFISNVMDYLYNDVTKFNHELLFDKNVKTYDGLYEKMTECASVLSKGVDDSTVGIGKELFESVFTKEVVNKLFGQDVNDEQGTKD